MTFEQEPVFVREQLRAFAYVSELFVRTEARRCGIASALIARAGRLAACRGVGRLRIGVLAGNDAAAALYARLGFTPHAVELEMRLDR